MLNELVIKKISPWQDQAYDSLRIDDSSLLQTVGSVSVDRVSVANARVRTLGPDYEVLSTSSRCGLDSGYGRT